MTLERWLFGCALVPLPVRALSPDAHCYRPKVWEYGFVEIVKATLFSICRPSHQRRPDERVLNPINLTLHVWVWVNPTQSQNGRTGFRPIISHYTGGE